MKNEELWNKFLEILKTRIEPTSYDTWFKDTSLYNITDGICYIKVPMIFHKDFLRNNYYDLILEILSSITNIEYEIEFVVEEEVEKNNNKDDIEIEHHKINSNLNDKYTFENFVVGKSNQFAKTISLAVAESPGTIYNPFFLYGKSGLGKTHLMHAIGHYIQDHTNKKVLYITSEEFIDDYTGLHRKDKTSSNFEDKDIFKEKYRNIDVLMIDDIQFLATAKATQDEFFHTFQNLYDSNKQIIISSDRSPDELKQFEERLVTRFRWGVQGSIDPPDFELKCQIIKNKMIGHEVAKLIGNEIVEYIASNCENDVRHLEGAITQLYAWAAMYRPTKINLEFAIEALKDYFGKSIYITNDIQRIQKAVADYFEITIEDMKSKKRISKINYARQIAMYLCRMTTNETIVKIGLEFGNRDHATVLHSFDKISEELKEKPNLRDTIEQIKNKIVN